jgi:phosphate transport system protein
MAKHFERDLERLQQRVLAYGAAVEAAIAKAIQALRESDRTRAEEVIRGDAEINRGENEISDECLKLIALHQPVASDLRRIATTLMITTDLERMGDQAKNISGEVLRLGVRPPWRPSELGPMTDLAQAMVRESLEALRDRNAGSAREVIRADDEVDRRNDEIIEELVTAMKTSPDAVEAGLSLYAITRHIERIADHTTNIAEDVVYLVEGDIVKHRPEAIGTAP